MIRHKILKFKTEEYLEFRDLTEEIERFLKESGIKEGQVLVFSKHTTVAVCINEKEKGIVKDFKNLLKKILPKDGYYCHNDLKIRTENLVCQSGESDCLNGHSHCTQLMMRNSEAIPVIDGKMTLGVWQRILRLSWIAVEKEKSWSRLWVSKNLETVDNSIENSFRSTSPRANDNVFDAIKPVRLEVSGGINNVGSSTG